MKNKDRDAYLGNLYGERMKILERLQGRVKQKEELQKRGSKGAMRRMQMLAELGAETE